jgi:hypothetical protein
MSFSAEADHVCRDENVDLGRPLEQQLYRVGAWP